MFAPLTNPCEMVGLLNERGRHSSKIGVPRKMDTTGAFAGLSVRNHLRLIKKSDQEEAPPPGMREHIACRAVFKLVGGRR